MARRLRTTYTKLPVAAPPKGRGAAELSRRAWRRQMASSLAVWLSVAAHVAVGGLWLRDLGERTREGRITTSGGSQQVADIMLEFVRAEDAATLDVESDPLERSEPWEPPPPAPPPSPSDDDALTDALAEAEAAAEDLPPDRIDGRAPSGAPQPHDLQAMMTVRALRPEPPAPVEQPSTEPEAIEWPEMPSSLVEPTQAPVAPLTDAPAPSDDPGPEAEPSGAGDTDTIVETRPEPLPGNRQPKYPRLARRRGWEGDVILSVRVLPTGLVDDAFVIVTSGRDVLDEAALDAVLGWRFEPARYDGEPVAGRRDVRIRFELLKR